MKFYIHTLGCKVNAYESNIMKENMIENGYIYETEADIHIINTCTVTNTADKKGLKLIRSIKKKYPNSLLVVTGCLSQIDPSLIEADIVIGNIGKSKIADYIKQYKSLVDVKNINDTSFEDMQLNNFDKTRAYIKIEDGCENFCTYCIIPYARGKVRCKDKDVIFEEAKSLIKNGHQEIVLTGIHTGHYYLKDYNFSDLLNDLIKIDGLKRIRISSIEINEISDEVLEVFNKSEILVDHIHIPLQSGSDSILKAMNRKYDKKYFNDRIEQIRKVRPDISITTDIIVGFPGETEELFKETIETVNKINFSKIHVFPFSRRKNTLADKMNNQVDEKVKKERVKKLIEMSKNLETKYFNKFLNETVIFIPEVYTDGFLIGHTGNYLMIKATGLKSMLHKEVKCIINKISYPYCIAEIIN
ncbi:MAG: tRNA (N(6)-L-threonylcarbamoyladenosine(37)-C(2))-methylthiotransferase MtaB [Bacilli bacterium]|nr:tRNA (N(6)-L-threonylcarbamoyladenosine(37)-C(2))-methylthiotransferase MtaB [Bacilli bacterium]MDD4733485.1 tRNA (N(6)-L-threonylcarbamoyladenosine(37)-C(2))-methylthiotransferase MtaB [Bacilli bacterium]